MLTFGMGLYVMFVGTRSTKGKGPWLSGSNLFGLFSMKVTFQKLFVFGTYIFTNINIDLSLSRDSYI
jgi:hypothetical protein